jgi:7-cyano-7-deazaguanine synthase
MENPRLPSAPEGYVPARNLVFYALALNQAEILGARYVIGGHNSGDSHVFPDASPRFFSAVNELGRIGLWSWEASPVEVIVPLSGLTKERVLQLGLELGVRFEHTWSCYGDGPVHCGVCESCRERQEAFRNIGSMDPVPYARPLPPIGKTIAAQTSLPQRS